MQDVTDVNFMRTVAAYGAPDIFVTEYLRVHETSCLEPAVIKPFYEAEITRPVSLQLIGEDIPHIVRVINLALKHPQIKMLDLNLGCPAPKVYKKNVGGGLLKDLKKIGEILRVMREAWPYVLSAKMRIGFEDGSRFEDLIRLVNDCGADFLTLHARTVKQLYRGMADHSYTTRAVKISNIPVVANGDISSPAKALRVLNETGCAGLMAGRGAMRNPWIFRQIKEAVQLGLPQDKIFCPTLADVRLYIERILDNCLTYRPQVKYVSGRLKKFINFIALGVDKNGDFLNEMRLTQSVDELLKICDKHLIDGGKSQRLFAFEPFDNLCARPNHE